jgi:hypothetical protein
MLSFINYNTASRGSAAERKYQLLVQLPVAMLLAVRSDAVGPVNIYQHFEVNCCTHLQCINGCREGKMMKCEGRMRIGVQFSYWFAVSPFLWALPITEYSFPHGLLFCHEYRDEGIFPNCWYMSTNLHGLKIPRGLFISHEACRLCCLSRQSIQQAIVRGAIALRVALTSLANASCFDATPFTIVPQTNTTLGYGFHFQHRNPRTFPIESLAHDSGRTSVCAEYGYPKGSPNTNS